MTGCVEAAAANAWPATSHELAQEPERSQAEVNLNISCIWSPAEMPKELCACTAAPENSRLGAIKRHTQPDACKACEKAGQLMKSFGSAGIAAGGDGTSRCGAPCEHGISRHTCKNAHFAKKWHTLWEKHTSGERRQATACQRMPYVQHQAPAHSVMKPPPTRCTSRQTLDTLSHTSTATTAAHSVTCR